MRVAVVGLAVILVFTASGSAEPETGTICVAANADDPFRGQLIPSTGEVSSNGLQVKVDKRPAIVWPQRESLKIDGLDLKERHLLAVVDRHGKPIESVWFRFTTLQQQTPVSVLRRLPRNRTRRRWSTLPVV